MVLLADESSNIVGGIEPDAKNTGGPTEVSGWDHIEGLCYAHPRERRKSGTWREIPQW